MRTEAEGWGPQVEPACVMVFMTVGEMERMEEQDGEIARCRGPLLRKTAVRVL